MRRIIVAGCVAIAAVLAPARPVSAHGGSEADLTSDYRTRITEIPDIDGLEVRTVGLDGTIKLSWSGPGTLVVAGYEGEPYLRFDDTGVAVNTRSPAAYLNRDRYANTAVPADADPTAEPNWQPTAAGSTYEWHDHRSHWMSTTPPPQAQQDPNRSHVVIERWEIPLDIDGTRTVVAGDLTWAPAPPRWTWIGLTLVITPGAAAVLWSRIWRPAATMLAGIGTIAFAADTAGFVSTIDDSLANKMWAFACAAVAVAATLRLIAHARRHTPEPTLAMMTAGLVLALMGGLDRLDVLTSGFYRSNLDITVARIATITSLAIGVALLARFLRFLVPLVAANPSTHANQRTHADATPTVPPSALPPAG